MTVFDSVAELLEQNRDVSLSGEQIARRLGVSRTAVWKAINALRAEGCQIEAATNRGYRLLPQSDFLSAGAIRPFLSPALAHLTLDVQAEVDSTHLRAKRAALEHPGLRAAFLAERQTAGRGRFGRSFYSPAGGGIYLSYALTPDAGWPDPTLITIAAAVAICRAVESLTGLQLQIKWVNDLFLEGKKVCGILTEAVTSLESGALESVVISPGINFRADPHLPEELRSVAGALFEREAPVSRGRLAAEILNRLDELIGQADRGAILDEYRARSLVLGRRVTFTRGDFSRTALALAIDDGGGLVVEFDDGSVETLHSGEVSVRPV